MQLSHKKNILFVIPGLYSAGAEHQTIDIINSLKNEYNIFLLVLSKELTILNRLEINQDHVFLLNSNMSSLSTKNLNFIELCRNIIKIKRMVKIYNINLVFANLPISHFLMRIIKIFSTKKFILCNIHHSLQYTANPLIGIRHKAFNGINNIFSYIADDLNIFISNASENDIKKNFYIRNGKSRIIYNGINISKFIKKNPFKKEFLDKFKIIIAGRMVPEKGHLFFLSAIKTALKQKKISTNIQIFLIGDGYMKKEIESYIINNNLSNYISIIGQIKREKLLCYFAYSDLVVIPSISEGFGNISIEAILAGATVLSSDAGGLKEIIKNGVNGITYNHKNSNDLLRNIQLLQKSKIKINTDQAIKYTIEKFSMNRMIDDYRDVIEDLIK